MTRNINITKYHQSPTSYVNIYVTILYLFTNTTLRRIRTSRLGNTSACATYKTLNIVMQSRKKLNLETEQRAESLGMPRGKTQDFATFLSSILAPYIALYNHRQPNHAGMKPNMFRNQITSSDAHVSTSRIVDLATDHTEGLTCGVP